MDTKEMFLQLNYAAENAHRKYLTFGYGHVMLYNEKAEQAADYIAAKYPKKLALYPLIEAEAIGRDKKPKDVANNIIKKRSEWVAVCAKIEKVRFTTLRKLDDAKIHPSEVLRDAVAELGDI